jgi:hypothetical protein
LLLYTIDIPYHHLSKLTSPTSHLTSPFSLLFITTCWFIWCILFIILWNHETDLGIFNPYYNTRIWIINSRIGIYLFISLFPYLCAIPLTK